MRPRIIALVGPRASGKTTLARALGAALGRAVADGDDRIADAVGMPAGEYLEVAGESAFRALEERLTLDALRVAGPAVVALGGGAVLSAAVRAELADADIFVVFVEASRAALVERLRASGTLRPPLTGLPLEDEVEALLRARRSLYETVADFRLETTAANVDACVAAILGKMRS